MEFETMKEIAKRITALANELCNRRITIDYVYTDLDTMENLSNLLTEYQIHDLGILGEYSYFLISKNGRVLYAVNVTGDSYITAATELLNAINEKF